MSEAQRRSESQQAAEQKTTATPRPRRAERRAEIVQQRRHERLHRSERQKRERLLTRLGLGALAVLLVAVLGIFAYNRYQEYQGDQVLEGVQTFDYAGGQHETGELTWTETPPVGGVHNPVWQNCGYYAAPVPPENVVHSLEHGAVWITYQPDLPEAQVAELRELAEEMDYILVSPFPDLPAPVVASSWNHQLILESADDPGLDAFIREYRNNPETTPEFGASCSGGNTGTLT
ncbi:MAG TPA: DUF3105 domain-containing protein [Thermomicrobiales bacterium]|nr:DUF3105 domain-containing protein [Thermomicrobiales bacterium]